MIGLGLLPTVFGLAKAEKDIVVTGNYTTTVNNCECRSNLYQLWIAKFMGINKHNLPAYTKTFEFIHNIRRKPNRRKKMFERILIGS